MPLINCKVDLKLQWTKYCVLSVAGADNTNTNPNHIIFPIKNTKFYVRVVNLSARDYQKLLKLLSKGFERSVYWNEYKTKSKNKSTANEHRYWVNRLFVLVYWNQDDNAKRFKAKRYYLPKDIIKNYNVIITMKKMKKKFMIEQSIPV